MANDHREYDKDYIQSIHPCFNEQAHDTVGRIHLPVAPKCNIQCNYCARGISLDKDEKRPGLTTKIVTPDEAMDRVTALMQQPNSSAFKIMGIAGPGDPLANEETFETLKLVGAAFPHLIKCISTNGLNLPKYVGKLYDLDIKALTVTVNAVEPEIGAKIYEWVRWEGVNYQGEEAAKILSDNQLEGIKEICKLGLLLKVNTILVPGINDHHIPELARRIKEAGASMLNIMQLVPAYKFGNIQPPSCQLMESVRASCETIIPQFKACKHCRADAVGIPGKSDDVFSCG